MSQAKKKSTDPKPESSWTFLSNYAHVLACLARDRDTRLRDVASQVGITERAVQKIVGDMEEAGVLRRIRSGRRNRYELNLDVPLRHPVEAGKSVGALLSLVLTPAELRRLQG